jgi:ribosomal protein L12E/L44/L45/RPP1/RPP2
MIQPGSSALRDALQKGDELFEQGTSFCTCLILAIRFLYCLPVSNPREAALDSEFLAICSRYAAEQANRLSTQMKSYDVTSYTNRLSLFLRGKLTVNADGLVEGPADAEGEVALKRGGKKRQRREEGEEEEEEEEEEEDNEVDDDQPLRWAELGALVAGFAQSTPSLDCLYIAFLLRCCLGLVWGLTFVRVAQGGRDGGHTQREEGEDTTGQEGEAR